MRILYRIPYPYFFSQHKNVGGHIAHSLGIVEGLIELGHEVIVLAHEGESEYSDVGAKFIKCESDNSLIGLLSRQLWLFRFFALSRKVEDTNKVDLIYSRYSTSALFHLIYDQLISKTKQILEVNSFGSQHFSMLKVLDSVVVSTAYKVIVVSQLLKEHVSRKLYCSGENCKVVINGVSKTRFRSNTEVARSDLHHFNIAFAGLIKENYGLEDAIECAKMLENDGIPIIINIYGDGPSLDRLRALSKDCDNIVFHGEIPFDEVPDVLSEFDGLLYITAPLNSFQSPTKLFEYMAIGKPIIACKTPQVTELLHNGEFGALFDISSPYSLYSSLLLFRKNYDLYLFKAQLAQSYGAQNHLWSARVKDILMDVC